MMKYVFLILIGLGIGVFLGWQLGAKRQLGSDERDILKDYQAFRGQLGTDLTNIRTLGANEFGAAGPWQASSTWVALGALKSLDSSNMADAKSRLASILATYYQKHSQDGDTNLLANIAAFAAKDGVLSNAITTPLQQGEPSK